MKKFILWILAAVVVVGASVAIFMSVSNKEQEVVLMPIEDPLFAYVNLEQLIAKGAFEKFIKPENRDLIATVLSSQLEGDGDTEHLKNIITNLDAIGIDIQTPIYGYLNGCLMDCVAVAKVSDRALLDRSIALLSYMLTQNDINLCEVDNNEGMRIFESEYGTLAYNDARIAYAFGNNSDSVLNTVKDAITRPDSDLSRFNTTDMAVLVNADRLLQDVHTYVNGEIEKLNTERTNGYISEIKYNKELEELNTTNELINSYSLYFNPNANILISTTFDLGRATLAYNSEGINFGEYATLCKPTNSEHLSNLGKDSYMVLSAGVDGGVLSQLVRTLLSGDMLQSIGIKPTNEVNMFISIACDALSTINGGVTLALDSVDGDIKQRYDYYWDEYHIEPSIKSIKAMLMADVTDTYIISNIAQFAGGFLKKVDATHYTLRLMNYNFSLGQNDSLLHLGVNMSPQLQTPSALDAEWAKDVENAIGYVVLNVDALMSSSFMKSTNKYVTTQIDEEFSELYSNATEVVSYIYASADSLESAEVVVVFDDKNVNALEQINTLVLPTLVKESLKSLF